MNKKTERIFTKVSNIKEYMEVLKSHGDKVLYRYPVGNEYQSMTYSAFYEQVMHTAAGFAALGLAGKRIAVIGPTAPEWVSSYLAVLVSGGVVIPMDKELDAAAIYGFLETAEAEAIGSVMVGFPEGLVTNRTKRLVGVVHGNVAVAMGYRLYD